MKKELTRQQYLDLYYFMRLNRAVEDTMVKLFRQNKIVGGLYSSLGQEAVSVGTAYALEKKDWLAPMIRNIGALLVKGVPPRDVFMQHMAKYDSPTKGKDGTSHFGDLENLHIVSPISMLGDLIPVMTGVAMAGRYLGQKIVAMTWIGDGGSSTGVFHEGMNFAAVQKAPFVLVLENNQWAYSTPVKRQVPLENLADRAKAYGIPSYVVDGNDVVAVYTTAKVTPPKSSVPAVWTVKGFGSGKASGGGSAPIHFGDTEKHEEKSKDTEVPEAVTETIKAPAQPRPVKSKSAKATPKKSAKSA